MPFFNSQYADPCMYCSKYGMDFTDEAFSNALKLIAEAVQDERGDEVKYNYLISVAPTPEDVAIIESIRNDEMQHRIWFREIYKYYTQTEIPAADGNDYILPSSYLDGINKAVFSELDTMENYRIIREGIPNRFYRDIILRIITDEMKHATKYNYLINKYSINQYIPEFFKSIT
jgi:rubrerythrin